MKEAGKKHPGDKRSDSQKRPKTRQDRGEETPTPRRRFLNRLWLLLASLGLLEVAVMLAACFKPRQSKADVPEAALSDLADRIGDPRKDEITIEDMLQMMRRMIDVSIKIDFTPGAEPVRIQADRGQVGVG